MVPNNLFTKTISGLLYAGLLIVSVTFEIILSRAFRRSSNPPSSLEKKALVSSILAKGSCRPKKKAIVI